MAVIVKIREKFGIVMIVLIAIAIIGFLLMDVTSSNTGMFGGRSNVVGVVNGEKINIQDFQNRIERNTENYQMQTNQPIDDQTRISLREQTWEEYVREMIMEEEYRKLGIKVTSDEIFDLVQGADPHPAVRQAFTNPETGIFDRNAVVNFLKNMNNDQTGETRTRWINFEKFLKQDRYNNKYNSLIKKGYFVPSWMAEIDHESKNRSVSFDFAGLDFNQVPDEDVSANESEMKNYLSKNKHRFRQEESVKLEYVVFNVAPSAEDSSRAMARLNELRAGLEETDEDSLFIRLNSDESFEYRYLDRNEITSSVAEELFTITPGTIVGPYEEDGFYKLSKLLDRKMLPDSVKVRHILLRVTSNQEVQAKRELLDSLETLALGGADFSKLANDFSEDLATAGMGGDLGWVKPGELFVTINDALFFRGAKGDVIKVPADDGFHLLKIDDLKPIREAVKVATLSIGIYPSSQTERAVYSIASQFSMQNNTGAKFKEAASAMEIRTADQVKKNDFNIIGLGVARELVRWAFNSNPGQVSSVISLEDKYVVAHLVAKRKEGTRDFNEIKTELETMVRREKKADILAKRLSDAMQGSSSVADVAGKAGTTVKSASGINFSSTFVQDAGVEPKLVASAVKAPQGQITGPVKGNNGVYVFAVTMVNEAPPAGNLAINKMTLATGFNSRVDNSIFEAIKKLSEIEDNRALFY